MQRKNVIVTGGATGIGRVIALKFAREGYNVIINYIFDEPKDLEEEIKALGVDAICIEANVGKFDEAERLIKESKKAFGTIDVLVNNAGITRDNLLIRMTEEEFDAVIETNLKGTFNTTRHVAGVMLKQKSGAIVNIASVVGLMGNTGQANYAASKAGVIGLTKTTAKELASRGVTANAVAPGFITTKMTEVLSDEQKAKLTEYIPLKKLGTPEDVAEVVYFLATNKYITGQVVNCDGGMVM
jgi:3-oxoacyl-[acyl-carrier protein] reductase